ncbi:(2Fe-2S)-binding protein [Luteimonas abyssi]|uniref:(2Fe-2S)-binding protein n=1 Tax=Luteimonas abyssi TaxID=1247514 RepID=UPI000737B76A|nr:(2Fe-2S)-binding protein [Luteimonas abyssi]
MYVCICNGVTDRDIAAAAASGCTSVHELTMRTGCGATCGSCMDMAGDLLAEARRGVSDIIPLDAIARAA